MRCLIRDQKKSSKWANSQTFDLCLGSGSVGSATFWLPGSGLGFAKICGSTDPNPRVKISTKNFNRKSFSFKTQICNVKKESVSHILHILISIRFIQLFTIYRNEQYD